MTLRLTVDERAWRAHVDAIATRVQGLVPVVKGNGYGFGRARLAALVAELARRPEVDVRAIAVGTVHELADVRVGLDVVVLTPVVDRVPADVATRAVLTVGAAAHVDALRGTGARVLVKLASSMHRFGRGPELIDAARDAGLDVIGVAVHPPLAGDDAAHADEIRRVAAGVDPALEMWVSHVTPDAYAALPTTHRYRLRLGTMLWHGDKSMLHLDADVLDVRPVRAGTTAGYRQHTVELDGSLVMVGAGTAHGVQPLADGRSPFHFARRRLALLEPPHMHTSMVFVPDGDPCPQPGDRVDVQRPLTTTAVDELAWR